MLAQTFAAGFAPAWVVGGEVYGRDGTLRRFLERRQQAYVLAVAAKTRGRREGTDFTFDS